VHGEYWKKVEKGKKYNCFPHYFVIFSYLCTDITIHITNTKTYITNNYINRL